MNRTLFPVAVVLGTSSLMLVDSAIKGAAILLLAALVTLMLRRDSAATRHLTWLVAIVGVLAVPVFSAVLPHWRVLPAWAVISTEPVAVESPALAAETPEQPQGAVPPNASPVKNEVPVMTGNQHVAEVPISRPAIVAAEVIPEPTEPRWNRVSALPLLWAIGFSVLVLRLMAARLMLWSDQRRGQVIAVSRRPWDGCSAEESDDPIVTAFQAACQQLGVRQPVRLLIHSERTIPVIWGFIRIRLLLPAAARQWSGEQLRSVLLHELAHVKRRDTLAQLLTQIACALHWFNPLVWFAAWRLHVERERACDDLVLASGVRASAYAEHLLNVVTHLSSSPWTQACGLTMARNSSLEGRLTAVLGEKLNRRGVTSALTAVALVLGAAIAIPIAMLHAGDDEPAVDTKPAATDIEPKHEYAQELFRRWQANARTDGSIPGGALRSLAYTVAQFIKLNPTDERVPKFTELLKRIDTSRDWTPAEAAALLDDVTAIYDKLPEWVGMHVRRSIGSPIQSGKPLPAELSGAAWGEPAENGLRVAWLLEPSAEQYPLNTALKARILFHNTGKKTVIFRTPTWHQPDHKASNAAGAVIKVSSAYWEGVPMAITIRLAPDEYAEVGAHGIAIGAENEEEETWAGWTGLRVGAWIEAKEGDEVTFVPGAVIASEDLWTMPKDRKTPAELWKAIVQDRIDREAPLPAAAADRQQLIRRVTLDLIGVPPTQEEIAAFTTDKSPDALAALGKRLLPRVAPFAGNLQAGEIKFRVTAADPDAANKPRVATGPGRYDIGDNVRLVVTRSIGHKPDRNLRVNAANIVFLSPDPKAEAGPPYKITLPDGSDGYAIGWERGSTVLWVAETGALRSYDFTNPAQVKETRFEPTGITSVPEPFRETLRAAVDAPGAPKQKPEPTATKQEGAQLPPGTEGKLQWGKPVNGLRAALSRLPSLGEPKAGQYYDFDLVVQNVSKAPIRLIANSAAPNLRRLFVRKDGVTLFSLRSKEPTQADFMLQPREVAVIRLLPERAAGRSIAENPDLAFCAEMEIEHAPAGAWTGRLYIGETSGAVAAGKPQPKDESAQSLFKKWQDSARTNGEIPGGALGSLAAATANFIKFNPTDERAPKLAELLKRMDTSRDWTQADAVVLLDDVTAIYANLPKWAEHLTRFTIAELIRTGQPFPAELENAPWGEAQPNGLRVAWLLDPRAEQHRLGTPLKSRILFHNAGKNAVVFRALSWNQSGGHKARDAKGAEIRISSTSWTTIPQVFACRLAPGEYTEVIGAGIGVGANKDDEDWRGTRVGAWIEAQEGDEVTFTPAPVSVSGKDDGGRSKGEPRWWLDFITDRLRRDMPLPDDAGERERLLDRAMRELFGTAPTPEETATFVADRSPDAFDALANRLAQRAGIMPFTGTLRSGETKFRVLAVDPDAAKKPRIATGPGRYTLGDHVRLVIVRRPDGDRRVNEANIVFFSPDPKSEPPGKPHEIKLPDGYRTWAIAWERGSTMLWVAEKGVLRSYDFATPAQVKETRIEPANLAYVPEPLREALRPALEAGSNASASAPARAKELP